MGDGHDLEAITRRAKQLVRQGKYLISQHVQRDHPEREITVADVLEVLKIGSIVAAEPRELRGVIKYAGPSTRYRWFGQDTRDRVLRLIVVVTEATVVVSAALATAAQTERYLAEDFIGLSAAIEDDPGEKPEGGL